MKISWKAVFCFLLCASLLSISGCGSIDRVSDVLQDGIHEFAPARWEESLNNVLSKLDEIGTKQSRQVANEIRYLMDDASNQLQGLMGAAVGEGFCATEFVGTRVELRFQQIAYDFFPDKFPKPDYRPAICNIVPDSVRTDEMQLLTYYGFDFTNYSGAYEAHIEEEGGSEPIGGSLVFLPNFNYRGTIQIRPEDMSSLDPNKKYKIVLTWNNIALENDPRLYSQRSEISIVPAPTEPPPPPPPPEPLPDPQWTNSFSEEQGTAGATCSPGWFVKGIKCTGDYCDNMSILCAPYMRGPDDSILGYNVSSQGISDESGGGRKNMYSSTDQFMAGMWCTGDYCDNLFLKMTSSSYLRNTGQCLPPSEQVSDEYQYRDGRVCAEGYWVAGLACYGDYCDNVSIICCQAGP